MTETLKIRDYVTDKVVVSRESAHLLENDIKAAIRAEWVELVIDFSSIEGASPSFIDELFSIFDANFFHKTLIFTHVPMEFSSKFEAIAKSHQRTIEVDCDRWTMSADHHQVDEYHQSSG